MSHGTTYFLVPYLQIIKATYHHLVNDHFEIAALCVLFITE